jgi:phospho-N-acetylmuramoyl-pentapeptide-transferase
MLVAITNQLVEYLTLLNIFKYITFRSGAAALTALFISLIYGERAINWLRNKQGKGQPIREDGPESHFKKVGTPTMGGVLILLSTLIATFLWADLHNYYIWIAIAVTYIYGALGLCDDWLKIKHKNSRGVRGKVKLLVQLTTGTIAGAMVMVLSEPTLGGQIAFPFFKTLLLDIGWIFPFFAAIVITGASNAVNLTDGLDGLASVPIIIAACCFALISYLVGNTIFAHYLQIHYIADSGELAVFCAAIAGAVLGFLWFNAQPAQIFMGDVGSLALGGAIGIVSVITKHELVLAIIGGLFVIEAVSVIMQVASFKLTGKRIFKMAPIHHHFEKIGWSESKIVIRFWIIAVIFAMLGLSTLKLR